MKDNTLLFLGLGAVAVYLYTKKGVAPATPVYPVNVVPGNTAASNMASSSLLLPVISKLAPSLLNLFSAPSTAQPVASTNTVSNQQLIDDNFSTDPINVVPAGGSNILYTPISNPISAAPFGYGSGSSSPIVDTSSTDFLNNINEADL